jgi:hypothetical protein
MIPPISLFSTETGAHKFTKEKKEKNKGKYVKKGEKSSMTYNEASEKKGNMSSS